MISLLELISNHDRVVILDESHLGATPDGSVWEMIVRSDLALAKDGSDFRVIKSRYLLPEVGTFVSRDATEVVPLEYEIAAVERLETISEDL